MPNARPHFYLVPRTGLARAESRGRVCRLPPFENANGPGQGPRGRISAANPSEEGSYTTYN